MTPLPRQVLVIEDESAIRASVCSHLTSEGYECVEVPDGRQALETIRHRPFDAIILDLMLPDVTGFDVCRGIRKNGPNRNAPVLILTARHREDDKLAGFDAGADDYLTKPFSLKELVARLRAMTRRVREATIDPLDSAEVVEMRGLRLDPLRRSLLVRGGDVPVTPQEFRLLYRLASNPEVVFTRARLLEELWRGEAFVTERSVDTLVHRLRSKIERNPATPAYIRTVWGDGYKFTNG